MAPESKVSPSYGCRSNDEVSTGAPLAARPRLHVTGQPFYYSYTRCPAQLPHDGRGELAIGLTGLRMGTIQKDVPSVTGRSQQKQRGRLEVKKTQDSAHGHWV
ncbi:hypothetical protein RRG08_002698 [Elysia crispata]|uniref:Uncharacterized protein n=1 Tax=Elysia crispata TaxID=231223 RepID=A0AAE0XTX0_9GAST|nr:hypothetical protein RRG08_002698 [Elysia crispata]